MDSHTSGLTDDLRLGRRIVACYEFVFIATLAVVIALFVVYDRPWNKLVKRAIWPALLHLLSIRGNRWARGAHVVLLVVMSCSLMKLGLRHPSPTVWAVCGPMSIVLAWLGAMLGFSPSVTAYLRHVHNADGKHAAGAEPARLTTRASQPEASDGVCPGCGEAMRAFVVLCPYCGCRKGEMETL